MKGLRIVGVVSGVLAALAVQAAGTPVKVKALQEVLVADQSQAPASVVNAQQVDVRAELGAVLKRLSVQVGDKVEAGAVLAQLECRDYELSETRAQAATRALQSQLQLAQQQLNRARTLQKSGSASVELLNQRQTEVNSLQAQLNGQQAAVEQAQRDVSRCVLKSPFSGVVTQVQTAEGALMSPGSAVLTLLNPAAAEVSVQLTPAELGSLQLGNAVFRASGQDYPLQFRAAVPLIDGAALTQEARLVFAERPALTGLTGVVLWQSAAMRVPPAFMVSRQQQLGVMLAKDSVAAFYPLPNARAGQSAVVDLPADTLLITQGQHVLEHGQAIVIEQEAMDNAAAPAQ